MGPFIQKLSDLAAPLHDKTKKGAPFEWTTDDQIAFDNIKKAVTESTTLSYFDPKEDIVLQVDASTKGLGDRGVELSKLRLDLVGTWCEVIAELLF